MTIHKNTKLLPLDKIEIFNKYHRKTTLLLNWQKSIMYQE